MTKNAIRRIALRNEIARLLAQMDVDAATICDAGYTLEDPSAHWFGTPADAAREAAEQAGRTSRLGAYAMRTLRSCAASVHAAAEHVRAAGPMSERGGVKCFLFVSGIPATVTELMFSGHWP